MGPNRRAERIQTIEACGAGLHPSEQKGLRRYAVNPARLPPEFPTHALKSEFWEELGRTVATFGFLENVLGRAIFAVTGTTELPEDSAEAQAALECWPRVLERALSDPLGKLIDALSIAIRRNSNIAIANLDALLDDLRKVAKLRNVFCHGFWQMPDACGRSVPFFVDRKIEVFETPVDLDYLNQVRKATMEMALGVINMITHAGWQFPGSSGPGKPIWPV